MHTMENQDTHAPGPGIAPPPKKHGKIKAKIHQLIAPWQRLPLRNRVLILVIFGIFITSATVTALKVFTKTPEPAPVAYAPAPEPEPEPIKTTAPSPLTGVEVDIPLSKLPVTAVMIENSPDARPQSGLNQAGVVFEAIAEGGITRFNALFQEAQPDYIGPVRSVRPYYLDFFVPFDAAIAHAGGSGQALAEIQNQGIKDIDQSFNPGYYQRVSSRYSPHNLYTSRAQLLELQKSKGFTESKFIGYPRKAEEPAEVTTANNIAFDISGFLYNTSYTYDKASNSYLRSLAGKPHTDERSGAQISPKVVIALESSHHYQGIYSVYQVTGSGGVTVFQDGVATKGTWSKAGRTSMFEFKTTDGEPLKLNAGQTWITMIPAGKYSFGL